MEEFTDTKLAGASSYAFDLLMAEKNVEKKFGAVQLAFGFVGPVKIKGDHAKGEFLVPMATTGFGTTFHHALLVKTY